ncbi:hypothetical protein HWV07_13275 [Natronomonas salina]|uniref:hypothetical protein n=1 Tax=Natronomonas salina TaxID=1710540 RepID=UPI0015B527B4|nr:hypothetical protein [Natronomonas salina]QLD89948.1 hypothetical protein HWV07_13275 [Natronomonas salina]
MEANGRIQCGCGSELSFSAADSRPRCECGALYAVTVTQLLGEGDVRACANCGGGADSRWFVSTEEWRREMALCDSCATELREEAGIDVPE